MYILAIETTGPKGSVAIYDLDGDRPIAQKITDEPMGHLRNLMAMTQELLQEEGGRKAMAYVKRARPVREDPLAGKAEELLLAAKDSFRKKPLKTRILYGLYRHARPLFYLTTAVFGKQSVQ